MSLGVLAILALLPIISVFGLIVLFKWPATRAMPIAYLVTCFLAFSVWKVPFLQLAAASIDGLLTAASAVVGLLGREGLLIRKTLIPMIYYLIVAAIIGIVMLQIFKT